MSYTYYSHPKSTAKLRIWGTETPEPIATKFCMPGAIQDIITRANFCEDRLRGFGVARGRILAFSINYLTCFVAFKTLSHYRASVRFVVPTVTCWFTLDWS